jgi:hypothetical protein
MNVPNDSAVAAGGSLIVHFLSMVSSNCMLTHPVSFKSFSRKLVDIYVRDRPAKASFLHCLLQWWIVASLPLLFL